MKTVIRIALTAMMFAAVASAAVETPKTAAGKALAGWVESFNTHDLAARKAYLKENTSMSPENIDRYAAMDVEFRESYGKFSVDKVISSEETKIAVILRHGENGPTARMEIEAEAEAPHKIKHMSLKGE